MQFPNLFSTIKINTLELKNRIVMTAMHLSYTPDGEVTDQLIDFYTQRSIGGVGLIIVGGCRIDDYGGMSNMIGLDNDRFNPGLLRFTKTIKNHGAKIAAQLYHAGRYTHSFTIEGRKPFSASAVRSRLTGETPRALEIDEIPQVQDKFANAALRAKEVGFDAVEILGSAGYLISQFLSPLTNLRQDKYGGSFENRMRFGLEVAEKVRKTVGEDFPVLMRIAGNDFMEGGNTNTEAKIFASKLEEVGIDLFNVTGGWHETRIPQLTMAVPRKTYVYLAQGIKSSVSVPVLASNRINDPASAEEILHNGEADLVTMARGLLADPDLPNKAREGNADLIYHCVACNQGCFDHIFQAKPATCLVNPRAGREAELKPTPAPTSKKVLVIGGGISGMKAACTAAERGHRVTLVEKEAVLGGQLLLNQNIPGRAELVTAAKDLINNIKALKVDIHLGKMANLDFIKEIMPDAAVIATGAIPILPEIPGIQSQKVIQAWDLLAGKVRVGKKIIIIGGNAVGLETALYLGHMGTISDEILRFLVSNQAESLETLSKLLNKGDKEVTVIEMTKRLGQDIGASTRWTVLAELGRLGVTLMTNARATEVKPNGLDIETKEGPGFLPADSIVLAVGSRSENHHRGELEKIVQDVYTVGDANQPRNALDAIREGLIAGLKL